ncbi:MAG: trigger factor [Acidobacteriia bacterium]|nr:trigger factor [Terriglobia bacterium]
MSQEQDCKHSMEFSVPVEEVEAEINRVVADLQKKAKLPGFRPGKVPASIIRGRFENEIRQDVLESIVPRIFRAHAEKENLQVVGTPGMSDIHFHKGEPLRFKVEFEVAPDFELGQYRGLTVPYAEPQLTSEDLAARLDQLRDAKADYVNVDPRPVESGDYAVVSLHSLAGIEGEPISNDEMMLHIGDAETMPEFNEQVTGMEPEQEKEFAVQYPENYTSDRLSGRLVTFRLKLKGLRRKELPELTDEFAADIGDYKNMDELREEVRKSLLAERENAAQSAAKNKLIDTLVDTHDFPLPDAFVDRQIDMNLEQRLRELTMQGVDPRTLKIDWEQARSLQRERAARDVKASLLLEKIADREAIETLNDEIDREIHRFSKQMREPAAAVRMKMEKDGSLRRLASRIRTDKVLNFLFEQARKVAAEPEPEAAE